MKGRGKKRKEPPMQRITKTYTDDMDASENAERHHVTIDGREYTIDLTAENWETATLADITTYGSRDGRDGRAPQQRKRTQAGRARSQEIRAWAATKPDIPPLADRGRIPGSVIARYEAEVA
jgi:hypothetical protein